MYHHNKENYLQLFRQYEHNISLMKNPEMTNLHYYPPEYKYFIENYKWDSLNFYRNYLMPIIGLSHDSSNYHQELISFLINEIGNLDQYFIDFTQQNDFIGKLLRRRNVSYSHYVTHSKKEDPLSNSMLQTYTKAYENDELLITWKYFSDKINLKKCDLSLKRYKQNGRILKGKLIKNISDQLTNYPKIQHIFDNSYHNKLRNSIDHNNVFIDENKSCIKTIDTDKILMERNEFGKTLYAIQSFHNVTLNFITTQVFNDYTIVNEGVIDAISINNDESNHLLCLLQLKPFFQNDLKLNSKIKTLYVKIDGIYLVFKTNFKEIIRLKIDYQLILWYINIVNKKVTLVSSMPVIEKQKKNYQQVVTTKGKFFLDFTYIYDIDIKRFDKY